MPYREAGVFTANGNGGITSATDDFSEGSTVLTTISTGSYAISNDGTGSLSFNNAAGHDQSGGDHGQRFQGLSGGG